MSKLAWRDEELTIEQWKANCAASSHVRPGEVLSFHEDSRGVVSCWIKDTSVSLGCYFIKGSGTEIKPSRGWNHQ